MTADTATADAFAAGQREAREAGRIALVDALNLPPETTWADALNSAALLPAALAESRSAEEYQRLVNALLCKPTEAAPLSNQDQNDARVAVRSTLMVMAIKLMAAAVRANPNARNYGAWKVGANPDADPKAEPGSPEDIEGWDIHVACVRPGGKGPADLVAEKVDEIDRLRAELAEAEATILNERGDGEPPCEGWVPFFEVDGEVEDATVCVTRWRVDMDGDLVCYAGVDAFQGGAWWAIHRKVDRRTVFLRSGDADTLRAAMRAATAAAKGGAE